MPIGFEYLDMNRQQAEIERITDQVMKELSAKNQDLGGLLDIKGAVSKLAKASGSDGYVHTPVIFPIRPTISLKFWA